MVRGLSSGLLVLGAVISGATPAHAQDKRPGEVVARGLTDVSASRPTIVLVDGAIGDANSWQSVIPILRKDGYKVIAVENRLASLTEDIAATKKAIDAEKGRVVLAGHSLGGAVITGAAGSPKVKALVYVAAFAPDANEPIASFSEKFPAAAIPTVPASSAILSETIPFPAWRTVRSWYLFSRDDPAITPDLQRFFARRMAAATCEAQRNRTVSRAQPETIARCIEEAAAATRK
jgi:pimeloyl-ACP methyl ester carboxylesterase